MYISVLTANRNIRPQSRNDTFKTPQGGVKTPQLRDNTPPSKCHFFSGF